MKCKSLDSFYSSSMFTILKRVWVRILIWKYLKNFHRIRRRKMLKKKFLLKKTLLHGCSSTMCGTDGELGGLNAQLRLRLSSNLDILNFSRYFLFRLSDSAFLMDLTFFKSLNSFSKLLKAYNLNLEKNLTFRWLKTSIMLDSSKSR